MVAANHCQLWGFKISIYQNVNLVTFFIVLEEGNLWKLDSEREEEWYDEESI